MTATNQREAWIVLGLGYGDEGKGSIVDFLARKRRAHTVIRMNGGVQAGHNVHAPDGRHHTFAQFGSAMFVPGVRAHLASTMLVTPGALIAEAAALAQAGVSDAMERTTVSGGAAVVTSFHRAANRLRELARGDGRHGSCGMGIGEAASDAQSLCPDDIVRVKDLLDPNALRRKLRITQERMRDRAYEAMVATDGSPMAAAHRAELIDAGFIEAETALCAEFAAKAIIVPEEALGEILERPGAVIFEGAQGALLDEWRGFHPFTTWSDCTSRTPLAALETHGYGGETIKLGLIRAYATRHGAGPFVSRDEDLESRLRDRHNPENEWQQAMRFGWLDLPALRYAIAANGGIDRLAVSCLDELRPMERWFACRGYRIPDRPTFELFGKSAADGAVESIRLGPPRDLERQASLASALGSARPVWTETAAAKSFEGRCGEHLARISAELNAPIGIASRGPTAVDKSLFP